MLPAIGDLLARKIIGDVCFLQKGIRQQLHRQEWRLGAGMLFLTGIENWETTTSSVPAMGFNGIAVAFLGGLSPIGSILSSFFIQYITFGGGNVDLQVYSSQISSLISSLIIYLCAFVGFFKFFIQGRIRKKDEKLAAGAAEKREGGDAK